MAGLRMSPSSPPVQHTSTVRTPSCVVAWPPWPGPFEASSSGWAWTVSRHRRVGHRRPRYPAAPALAAPCPPVPARAAGADRTRAVSGAAAGPVARHLERGLPYARRWHRGADGALHRKDTARRWACSSAWRTSSGPRPTSCSTGSRTPATPSTSPTRSRSRTSRRCAAASPRWPRPASASRSRPPQLAAAGRQAPGPGPPGARARAARTWPARRSRRRAAIGDGARPSSESQHDQIAAQEEQARRDRPDSSRPRSPPSGPGRRR